MLIHHLEITHAIVFLDFMAKIVKEVIIVIPNSVMDATLVRASVSVAFHWARAWDPCLSYYIQMILETVGKT